MGDTCGTRRRGQESDQSPQPEMIKTDPLTAGGKERKKVRKKRKTHHFFHHNEIPATHSQRALLSKTILKLVMWGDIEKKVVKLANGMFQRWVNELTSLKM